MKAKDLIIKNEQDLELWNKLTEEEFEEEAKKRQSKLQTKEEIEEEKRRIEKGDTFFIKFTKSYSNFWY